MSWYRRKLSWMASALPARRSEFKRNYEWSSASVRLSAGLSIQNSTCVNIFRNVLLVTDVSTYALRVRVVCARAARQVGCHLYPLPPSGRPSLLMTQDRFRMRKIQI